MAQQPYVTIRSRQPSGRETLPVPTASSSTGTRSATHDISRVSYHVKHVGQFAQTLEDAACRAFPNRGLTTQRYRNVQALLLHWRSDDLFVLPELEDLEKCLREDYKFETEIYAIPSENAHLELMMKIGLLIKEHEAQDTLFLVYYGGHAKIDESRQSRWCATRQPDSSWLQWSAIQTLLERSVSDVLILLDCCAGAASATFPTGSSITETISASSWDTIAPDPGRYSFTNALIEVLQDWRLRTFSAAMLHAEVLARLKHPRPITINGKLFEARSTPVHFMMTSNHKAPSIEVCRIVPADQLPPSPPQERTVDDGSERAGRAPEQSSVAGPSTVAEPNDDTPHVMISLALEDDQSLDLSAWEQWLASFPALAKYVKVQGVFKSHSTLLLLSLPVMVWDLLPEDHATSFVAFIRSNNLIAQKRQSQQSSVRVPVHQPEESLLGDDDSLWGDNTTLSPTVTPGGLAADADSVAEISRFPVANSLRDLQTHPPLPRPCGSSVSIPPLQRHQIISALGPGSTIARALIYSQERNTRRTTFGDHVPEAPRFASHIEQRMEQYYQNEPLPNDAQRSFIASNLGIDAWHIEAWFHHRRERDRVSQNLQSLKMNELPPQLRPGPRMILPAELDELLEATLPGQVLIMDLRSRSEFDRSRINGAINLHAPANFLQHASLDMIEAALSDSQSRRIFSSWKTTTCMVLYFKSLEYTWECPTAEILFDKFKALGWPGQCFVLKGHYREFSTSFTKHIVGTTVRQEAVDHAVNLRSGPYAKLDLDEAASNYAKWLSRRDAADLTYRGSPSEDRMNERRQVLDEREKDLEADFQARFPDLYEQTKASRMVTAEKSQPWARGRRRGKDDLAGTTAHMVEYLDRGLEKMRDAQPASPPRPEPSKLSGEGYSEGYLDRPPSDDSYIKISKTDAQASGDTGFKSDGGSEHAVDDAPRKGRGGFLNKMLRRT